MPSNRSKSQERVRNRYASAKMSKEDKESKNARRRMLSANKSEEEKEKRCEPKGYKGMSYEEELRRNKEEIRKI